MKKISFIIISGMVALAACTNNNGGSAKMQATIDSTVNAFVTAQQDVLTKACDDQLMAAAQDSAKVMMENAKKGTHVAVHHAAPVKAAPPKDQAHMTKADKMGTQINTAADKATKMGTQNNTTTAKDKASKMGGNK